MGLFSQPHSLTTSPPHHTSLQYHHRHRYVCAKLTRVACDVNVANQHQRYYALFNPFWHIVICTTFFPTSLPLQPSSYRAALHHSWNQNGAAIARAARIASQLYPQSGGIAPPFECFCTPSPSLLLTHSFQAMGGLVSFASMADGPTRIAGAMLTSYVKSLFFFFFFFCPLHSVAEAAVASNLDLEVTWQKFIYLFFI
jgi:hypothetical protein